MSIYSSLKDKIEAEIAAIDNDSSKSTDHKEGEKAALTKVLKMFEDENLIVTLSDENGDPDANIDINIRKGVYGVWMELSPRGEGDSRGVMLDYFEGKLSVKVWADKESEDPTNSILLKTVEK